MHVHRRRCYNGRRFWFWALGYSGVGGSAGGGGGTPANAILWPDGTAMLWPDGAVALWPT